jgi:uncharacterized membrane protein YhaH (DUF805 family)
MSFVANFFVFSTRLARGTFVLRLALFSMVFVLANAAIEPLLGDLAVWVINPVFLWILIAQCAQRLHDRNLSAYWLLLGIFPVIGAAWLLWQFLGKGRQTDGRWSAEAAQGADNFLVVR